MKRLPLLPVTCPAAATHSALADEPLAAIRAACADDAQKLCAGVQTGGGRIIACLKQHKDSLSAKCKQAAAQVSSQGAGPARNAAPAAPAAAPKPTASDAADALIAAPTATKPT